MSKAKMNGNHNLRFILEKLSDKNYRQRANIPNIAYISDLLTRNLSSSTAQIFASNIEIFK
jgi:hypothetical protein